MLFEALESLSLFGVICIAIRYFGAFAPLFPRHRVGGQSLYHIAALIAVCAASGANAYHKHGPRNECWRGTAVKNWAEIKKRYHLDKKGRPQLGLLFLFLYLVL